MGIRDAFGDQPQQQNELLRQLGWAVTQGQPDFRAGRGSDGPFDGLGSAIADLVGGPTREEAATRDLLDVISARDQRMAKAPALPGANSPRPRDVVQGFTQQGLTPNTFAAALRAIQSAPYELGVRQGDPRAREVYNAQVEAQTQDLLGDDGPTDEMLDASVKNTRAASLLDEAYGSGRRQLGAQRNENVMRQADKAQSAFQALADPYQSAAGATVALSNDDLGREVVSQPTAQRIMHNDAVRGATLDALEQVKRYGVEKIDDIMFGEQVETISYPDGDPEAPETSPSFGAFADLLLNPSGASKIGGKPYVLSVRAAGVNGSSKEQMHQEIDAQIAKFVADNEEDDLSVEDVKAQLRIPLEEEMTGIRTKAGASAKIDPKIRQLASEIYGKALLQHGKTWYLTNQSEGAKTTDHKLVGGGDFSAVLGKRMIRNGQFQGRPALAEQYGLSSGQGDAVKNVYRTAAEKLIGPMESFLQQKFTADLKARGVDDAAIENLVDQAMAQSRSAAMQPGVKKAFQRDPEKFFRQRIEPNWNAWLDGQSVPNKKGMTPAAAGFVRAGEAIESSEALQQAMSDPLGGMGSPQDADLMQMLEEGRQPREQDPGASVRRQRELDAFRSR